MEGSTLSIRRVLQRYDRAFHLDEPKTARSRRTIVLPRPVGAGLREHRSRQLSERLLAEPAWQGGECGDLVFTTETGEPLHGKTVTRRPQKLLSEASMPRLRFHDLRHTAATLMLVMGVPLETIQETLGHASFGTTKDIYAHVLPSMQREAADRMGEFLRGEASV